MSIETPPTAPSRSMTTTAFNTAVEDYLAWVEDDFVPGVNALAVAGAFDAALWVSGTTYVIGDLTWSPIDYNVYRRITNGAGTTDPSADATNWAVVVSVPTTTTPRLLENVGFTVTMAANAATISLKGADGAAPSSSNKVGVGFRSATITSGASSKVQATGAISTVISSGSTGGATSAVASRIWVAAILTGGAIELAWCNANKANGEVLPFDEGALISTTAEGGAGAADSALVWYSTTARASVPFTVLGYFDSTQATAGTWVTAVTDTVVNPSNLPQDTAFRVVSSVSANSGTSNEITGIPAAKRLIVTGRAISTNGTNGLLLQAGDAGGYKTTGYVGGVSAGAGFTSYTTGFGGYETSISAGNTYDFRIVLEIDDPATWTWLADGDAVDTTALNLAKRSSFSRFAMTGPITSIKLTTLAGTDVFDGSGILTVKIEE